MSKIFKTIIDLIQKNEIRISNHGYDELMEDSILLKDILFLVSEGTVIEEYPDYYKGPCVLVLQKDMKNNPIHVVWGIPKGFSSPAVLITAYRPDSQKWHDDFMRRKS